MKIFITGPQGEDVINDTNSEALEAIKGALSNDHPYIILLDGGEVVLLPAQLLKNSIIRVTEVEK